MIHDCVSACKDLKSLITKQTVEKLILRQIEYKNTNQIQQVNLCTFDTRISENYNLKVKNFISQLNKNSNNFNIVTDMAFERDDPLLEQDLKEINL